MSPRRARERGIALLLVLWVFMILGVLAIDFATYMRDDAMAAVNFADETRGYYIALAGMNRALFDAEQARERTGGTVTPGNKVGDERGDEDADLLPSDGQWHDGTFAGGHYRVRMTDEGGLISLNRVSEALLTRVVTNLMQGGQATAGLDRHATEQISTVVDSILDWRDPDNLKRLHGAENAYYLKLRVPYRAKNSYFDSPEELLQVRGVTPDLYYGHEGTPGLRDIVSVYNRGDKLNVRTAPAAVLQVVLAIDAEAAADLVSGRGSEGVGFIEHVKAALTAVDPALVDSISDEVAHTVTLEAQADTQDPRNQSYVAAVMDISSETSEGPRVLRWMDRVPVGAAPPPGVGDPA